MEGYSGNDELHTAEDRGVAACPTETNIAEEVNKGSETLETNGAPEIIQGSEALCFLSSKENEIFGDSSLNTQSMTECYKSDNLSSQTEETNPSTGNDLNTESLSDTIGVNIESELEKVHADVSDIIREKTDSATVNDIDKVDWSDDIAESTSTNVESANVQVETPVEHIEMPVEHSEMPVEHTETPVVHIETPVEHIKTLAEHIETPVEHIEMPVEHVETPIGHVETQDECPETPADPVEIPIQQGLGKSVAEYSKSGEETVTDISEENAEMSSNTESDKIKDMRLDVQETCEKSSEVSSTSVEQVNDIESLHKDSNQSERGVSIEIDESVSEGNKHITVDSTLAEAQNIDVGSKSSEIVSGTNSPIEHEPDYTENGMDKTSDSSSKENNTSEDKTASLDANNLVSLEQEKNKASHGQRENTEFVQVSTENEKDSEDNEKDEEANNRGLMEHDPIASDSFEPINNEDREGADAELCIIPDTEREISQAEKDAASTIPPLRDLSEASASAQAENNLESVSTDQSSGSSIIIFKYEKEDLQICNECKLKRKVKYYYISNNVTKYLCDDNCLKILKNSQDNRVAFNWEEGGLRVKIFTGAIKEPPSLSFIRKCASCKKVTNDIENNLTWEIMDFCNEFCLSKYQKEIGSHCSSCQGEVKSNSLGKYCVRFGNDIRQFCTSICLEKYKKGLKVCSYCQQDMSGGPAGFLAPVGDKGQFKDFCSQLCMEKYDIMTNDRPPKVASGTICSVCKAEKPITIEFELDGISNYFCSEPCFVAFSFVNNISPGKCAMCRRHFTKATLEKHTMYYDNVQHSFCSNSCENIYIIAHRKIVPCSWCKVKKYNFDMIRRYSKTGPMINMCSVNCLSLYQVSINAVNSRKTICNFCLKLTHPMYHLTMSDATIRNFCSYSCVMGFQNQFPKQPITLTSLGDSGFPVPTGTPKRSKKHPGGPENIPPVTEVTPLPIISSVQSLATTNGNLGSPTGVPPSLTPINTRTTRSKANTAPQVINSTPQIINSFADLPVQVQIKQHFIVKPAPMPEQRNVGTMCYTRKANKGTTMKPIMVDKETQTEMREASKILIPVPVPIYVPTPMRMFSIPTPCPVPFPVPIPVPIFIPTTRNSAAGIMKEIKKIQVKIPTDPYEAELLMMAEMVAEEKKEDVTDSESEVDDVAGPEDSYSPEPVDASNTFGDDMLQMALKMATELDEPAVDLEGALTANTITAPQGGETHHAQEEAVDDPQPIHHSMERGPSMRGRKRGMRQSRGGGAKRGRRMSHHQVELPLFHQVQHPPPPPEPAEKPDANMCLKYTFGVNAWKQWVTTKNSELEKSSTRIILFKTEILQLTSDELNYSLCLFVKEVRKPNGAEYAPDTIYYLCLGIQQYLFENGRIDNIFCDPYYEKFTDCLDEVAKKFSVLYNDSHYIVTRVEEEHLWESKQLGAHSPHVLLSTLMFFNTKHFNLTSVDEHMQLSFSHIMKHWKRNPNQPGASKVPGSRNVLLRFYPPQSAIQNNTRKKKVYEQEQNEENPLRCPVKLYEFYLSKCPESVKTRNDVFYLQPERSCVPDSPVWYSTMPLPRDALEKMLHRVKMVKEINVALLTS